MCGSRLCPEWTGHLGVMELFADLHPTSQVSVLATQPLMGSGKQSMEKVGEGGREETPDWESGGWVLAPCCGLQSHCPLLGLSDRGLDHP